MSNMFVFFTLAFTCFSVSFSRSCDEYYTSCEEQCILNDKLSDVCLVCCEAVEELCENAISIQNDVMIKKFSSCYETSNISLPDTQDKQDRDYPKAHEIYEFDDGTFILKPNVIVLDDDDYLDCINIHVNHFTNKFENDSFLMISYNEITQNIKIGSILVHHENSYTELENHNYCLLAPVIKVLDMEINTKTLEMKVLVGNVDFFTDIFEELDADITNKNFSSIPKEKHIQKIHEQNKINNELKNIDKSNKFNLDKFEEMPLSNNEYYYRHGDLIIGCFFLINDHIIVKQFPMKFCTEDESIAEFLMKYRKFVNGRNSSNSLNMNNNTRKLIGSFLGGFGKLVKKGANWFSGQINQGFDVTKNIAGEVITFVGEVGPVLESVAIEFGNVIYEGIAQLVQFLEFFFTGKYQAKVDIGHYVEESFDFSFDPPTGFENVPVEAPIGNQPVSVIASGDGSVHIKGNVQAGAYGSLSLLVKYGWNGIIPSFDVLRLKFESFLGVDGYFEFDITNNLNVELALDLSRTIIFFVGPVPVVIDTILVLSLATEVETEHFNFAVHGSSGYFAAEYGFEFDGSNINTIPANANNPPQLTSPKADLDVVFTNLQTAPTQSPTTAANACNIYNGFNDASDRDVCCPTSCNGVCESSCSGSTPSECCIATIKNDNNLCGFFGQMSPCVLPPSSASECESYGGIPNTNGDICCAGHCNFCTGPGCSGAGGAQNCCGSSITNANKICGSNGQAAPCLIDTNTVSDTCFWMNLAPELSLSVGVIFYKALQFSYTLSFSISFIITYPDTCNNGISRCDPNEPKKIKYEGSTDLKARLDYYIGLNQDYVSYLDIFGIDISDYVGIEFNLFKTSINTPSSCSNLNVPSLIESCCPDITNPDPYFTPTHKPISQENLIDNSVNYNKAVGIDYPYQDVVYYIKLYNPSHSASTTYFWYLGNEQPDDDLYAVEYNSPPFDDAFYFTFSYEETYGNHTYNIKTLNPDAGSYVYLSTTTSGDIDFYHKDDNSGRQHWVLKRAGYSYDGTPYFRIDIRDGTDNGKDTLTFDNYNNNIFYPDLQNTNPNNKPQHWILEQAFIFDYSPISMMEYYIIHVGTNKKLHVKNDGTLDLVNNDDFDGRVRWTPQRIGSRIAGYLYYFLMLQDFTTSNNRYFMNKNTDTSFNLASSSETWYTKRISNTNFWIQNTDDSENVGFDGSNFMSSTTHYLNNNWFWKFELVPQYLGFPNVGSNNIYRIRIDTSSGTYYLTVFNGSSKNLFWKPFQNDRQRLTFEYVNDFDENLFRIKFQNDGLPNPTWEHVSVRLNTWTHLQVYSSDEHEGYQWFSLHRVGFKNGGNLYKISPSKSNPNDLAQRYFCVQSGSGYVLLKTQDEIDSGSFDCEWTIVDA